MQHKCHVAKSTDNPQRVFWPYLLIGLSTLVLFAKVLGLGTIDYDDNIHIFQNPLLNPPSLAGLQRFWAAPYMGMYIPVTYSVWMLLVGLARSWDPATYQQNTVLLCHLASLLLHVCNAALVYRILQKKMGFTPTHAVAGALIFIMHPLQVESVAWLSSLRDLISALGCLITLDGMLACAMERDAPAVRRFWRYTGILVSYTLAMLAKPTAIVTPLLGALLVSWTAGGGIPWRRMIRPGLLLALPAAAVMGITKLVQPDQVMDHIPALITRPLIALDAIFFYLGKMFWPLDLCIDYGRTPAYVLALGWPHAAALLGGGLLVVVLCIALYRHGMSLNLLVALFFLVAISPVLGFIPFVHQDVSTNADRYLYLGLFALAWSASLLCRRHRAMGMLLVFVMTLLAGLSHQQISYWQDPHAVFEHTLAVNPHSGAAKNMLGRELLLKGENSLAVTYFEDAIGDRPQLEPAYNNLGVALLRLGRKAEAIDNFKKALARSPDYLDPRYNLANALRDTGAFAEAQKNYLEVLQSMPSHDQAHFNLGLMLLNQSRPAEALIHFTAVTHLTPLDPDAYEGRADALCGTKDYAEAVDVYQHALNMSPGNLRIRRKMALALIQINRTYEALGQLDQILQILPGAVDIIELKRQIKMR